MRISVIAVAGPFVLVGCLSYGARDYSAMSAYDLCELENFQRVNLTAPSKTALKAELERRNESCSGLIPQIVRDREEDRHDRMYNRQSP